MSLMSVMMVAHKQFQSLSEIELANNDRAHFSKVLRARYIRADLETLDLLNMYPE